MKVTVIPIVIDALGPVTKELIERLEDLEIRGRVATFQTIVLSSQNTKKSPGDWRRPAITQTPVRKHQLTLV